MDQDHSANNISLTPREISKFALYLARNNPTDEERQAFFESMPERIDSWFALRRGQKKCPAVARQVDYLQPES